MKALTPTETSSPPAGRPYDRRHAAVARWLNAGVPSTQVADRAGHSRAVLRQSYATCLVGQEKAVRRPIDAVLGGDVPETSARVQRSHLAFVGARRTRPDNT